MRLNFPGTTKRKLVASSSIFCSYYSMSHIIRKSNNVIFKLLRSHDVLSFLLTMTATAAVSSLLYHLVFSRAFFSTAATSEHAQKKKETGQIDTNSACSKDERRTAILKRKHLENPEEKYASLRTGNRFLNPFEEWTDIPFYRTLMFWLRRYKGNGIPKNESELKRTLPTTKPDFAKIMSREKGITFTWFGQSTCLMTIDGLTILSDPVFSNRSINDYVGPKRLRPIPCSLEEIVHLIDIVVVSHDHFDHLNERAVETLGNSVTWYVPLNLGRWLSNRGITNVVEMDWWQEARHAKSDTMIACVPAMHWSGSRTPFEKNNTLWCSYVIKSENNAIFFCGDTGYSSDLFQAIGRKYAPFKLAAIPIGSFLPIQLMQHLHMGPEDAIKAHLDLKCPTLSVGIHWGTFMMSDEYYLAPKQILEQSWSTYKKSITVDYTKATTADEATVSSASSNATGLIELDQATRNNHTNILTEFVTTNFGQTIELE